MTTRVRWNTHAPRLLQAAFVAMTFVFLAIILLANRHAVCEPEGTKASGSNAHQQLSSVKAENALDTTYQRPRIKWELLDFRDKFPSPSRRAIKSVCLIQFKDSLNNPLASNTPIKEKIDSDDPLVVQRTERGLCDADRSAFSDLEPKAFAMDNVAWGSLRVTATDGEFVIFIYGRGRGFAIDFNGDRRSSFRSWTLSRVIDDLYVGKTGKHLGQKMLDSLSGESAIRDYQQEYAKECQYLQKIKEYSAILEKDRKTIKTYMARADALLHVGHLDAAIADYTRAIELSPDDAKTWFKRGLVYHVKTDSQRAIADFTKAIQLAPKFFDAYRWRGEAYMVLGNKEKADADWKVFDVLVEDEDKSNK